MPRRINRQIRIGLVTVYADFPPEGLVGDLCAAPGGKTLAMAGGGAYVLAADRSLSRHL